MDESKNYSIVCYLESDVRDKVRKIQEKLFELTGSRKCLDAWQPHITLGSGIIVSPEKQQEVEEAFRKICAEHSPFDIELRGFGGTVKWGGARQGVTSPYVLWINPLVNDQLMNLFNTIADNVTSHYEVFYPRIVEYVPHVTVAYADLEEDGYAKGGEFLKLLQFDDKATISHIALVENFPEKDIEYKRFYLKK